MDNKCRIILSFIALALVTVLATKVLAFGQLKDWLPMLPITQIVLSESNPTPLFEVLGNLIKLNPNFGLEVSKISTKTLCVNSTCVSNLSQSSQVTLPPNACLLFNNTSCPANWKLIRVLTDFIPTTLINITIRNPNPYDLNNYQVRINFAKLTKAVNGDKVFDFYDDFKFKDTSKWNWPSNWIIDNEKAKQTVSNWWSTGMKSKSLNIPISNNIGVVLETLVKNGGTVWAYDISIGVNISNTWYSSPFFTTSSTWYGFFDRHCGGSGSCPYGETRQWHIYRVYIFTNHQYWYLDNQKIDERFASIGSALQQLYINSKGIGYFDWIRVRKYADQEPTVLINPVTQTIMISNPNNYYLTNFQVHIPKSELDKVNGIIIDIQDQNGNTLPFCYEHSNGECDNSPEDIQGIWIRVPNILANSQIALKYLALNDILNNYRFKLCYDKEGINCVNYCFEQPNGECNNTPSNVIWAKVNLLANSNTILYLIPSDKIEAVNGDQVFDFYDDFNGNSLDTNKWEVKYFRYDGTPDAVKYVKVENGYVEIALQDGTMGDGGSSYGIEADISSFSFNSIVIEYRSITPNWGGTGSAGWYRGTGETIVATIGYIGFSQNQEGNKGHQNDGVTSTTTADYSSIYRPDEWHVYKITHKGSESKFFIDGNFLESLSSTPPTPPFISIKFSAGHWGTTSYPVSILRVDWVRVRKYTDQEPRVSINVPPSHVSSLLICCKS